MGGRSHAKAQRRKGAKNRNGVGGLSVERLFNRAPELGVLARWMSGDWGLGNDSKEKRCSPSGGKRVVADGTGAEKV